MKMINKGLLTALAIVAGTILIFYLTKRTKRPNLHDRSRGRSERPLGVGAAMGGRSERHQPTPNDREQIALRAQQEYENIADTRLGVGEGTFGFGRFGSSFMA